MNPDEIGADDPLEALKRLKTPAPADDPLAQLKALRPQPQGHDYHAEFRSGALAKRMEGANARDAANAAEDTEAVSPLAATGHALAATGANFAQGIPGMELAQAGTRALVRGQPYREALGDIRGQTDKIPDGLHGAERIAGSLPLAAVIPGGPVTAGAILGGADQALSADPDQSLGQRAMNTAVGTVAGAATGKAAEWGTTALRSLLAPTTAANLLEQRAARAKSAKGMYDAAISIGKNRVATSHVQRVLAEPDIAPIVAELGQMHDFAHLAPDSPEMLDAVYKTLSDRAGVAKRGLDVVSPNRPNIGRFRLQDIRGAQGRLLKALGMGETVPGTVTTREVPPLTTAQSPAPSLLEAIQGHQARIGEAARRAEGSPLQQNRNPFSSARSELPPAHVRTRDLLEAQSAQSSIPPTRGAPQAHTITDVAPDTHLPAMMPTYENAVDDFANKSSRITATERGHDAVRGAVSSRVPAARNLATKSPEGLAEWAKGITPDESEGATEGILGGVKAHIGQGVKSSLLGDGRRAAWKAPGMMRTVGSQQQRITDELTKLGLIGVNAEDGPTNRSPVP